MKNLLFSILITLSLASYAISQDQSKNPDITGSEISEHIKFLASDNLKGRFTGDEGGRKAAEYINKDLETSGLKPLFGNSFFQEYEFVYGIKINDGNSISFNLDGNELLPELKKEFVTTGFSGNNNLSAKLVFAGYGISAPKLKYDDYEGIDVKGKIVIVMRYDPQYNDNHSQYAPYASARQKASVAKEKGAVGIIYVNGYFPKDDEDKLMEVRYDRAPSIQGFSCVHVKRSFIDRVFAAEGLDFKSIQEKITESKAPNSFELKKCSAKIKTDITEVKKTGLNVAGVIEGTDPVLKNEYLVVGAHFDHLGMGETGSLYRGKEPMIHNGADDNASGTAGVLELAEKFASIKANLKRSIIFVLFSGEEIGLLGSSYFASNSPIPAEKMISMINLDMIGRLKDSTLIVYGTGTSKNWKTYLNEKNSYGFKITMNDEGYGPSDHSSFYAKKMPVLFFFTGTHTDYHRPSDQWDKINSEGESKVVNFVYNIAQEIDLSNARPDYINIAKKEDRGGGWKVYVGTVPDYSYTGKGLKINGVNENSPANKAGMQGGDIMIKFGSKEIGNIYDYVDALGIHSPGDIVEIIVDRAGVIIKLKLELGAK